MEDLIEKINSMSIDIAQLLHGQNTLNNFLSTIQILQKQKKKFNQRIRETCE